MAWKGSLSTFFFLVQIRSTNLWFNGFCPFFGTVSFFFVFQVQVSEVVAYPMFADIYIYIYLNIILYVLSYIICDNMLLYIYTLHIPHILKPLRHDPFKPERFRSALSQNAWHGQPNELSPCVAVLRTLRGRDLARTLCQLVVAGFAGSQDPVCYVQCTEVALRRKRVLDFRRWLYVLFSCRHSIFFNLFHGLLISSELSTL